MKPKTRILVVWSKCDFDSGDRVNKLVKYLVAKKYKVTFIVKSCKSEILGAEVIRVKSVANPIGIIRLIGLQSFARKLNKYLFIPDTSILFSIAVFRYLQRHTKKFDVIITSSPFEGLHFIGLWCKKYFGMPWIADFRDQWTQDTYRYKPATPIHNNICKKIEKIFYNSASCVIANTPPFGEMLKSFYGVDTSKLLVITNGYDPDDYKFLQPISSGRPRDCMSMGFLGSFKKGRKIATENILLALKWANKKGAKIKLNIYGNQASEVNQIIEKWKVEKYVTLHTQLPHREALNAVSKNDILLVCLEKLDYTDKIVPLKLYEYLKIPKPILGILPKNEYAAKVIEECKAGVVFSPNEDLGEKCIGLYYRWKNGEEFRNSSSAINEFSWSSLISKWEVAIKNTCKLSKCHKP